MTKKSVFQILCLIIGKFLFNFTVVVISELIYVNQQKKKFFL
jgi:hypothetical protein